MELRKFIRRSVIDRLPRTYRLAIERQYLYHYYGDDYIGRDVRIIRQLCDRDKNSLDVGANWGLLTLYLSKLSSHVYCFEPVPSLCDGLKAKFQGCNVSVMDYALGNVNSDLSLNIPWIGGKRMDTRSSLANTFNGDVILGDDVTEVENVTVKVKKLDDIGIRNIGFMKVDVEGFEMEVLEGASATIREYMPNLLIEIEQRHHNSRSIHEVFRYLQSYGYVGSFVFRNAVLRLDEFDPGRMQDIENEEKKDLYVNNFIFSRSRTTALKLTI
jgi:FkbM family methyltransferase